MLNGYENLESYLDWLCNNKQAFENSEMFKK